MGNKKRQRTAQHRLTQLDHLALGMAEEDIFNHNFCKLLESGMVVQEVPKKRHFLYRKLIDFTKGKQ